MTESELYRSDLLRAAKGALKYSDDAISIRTAVYTKDRKPISRQTVGQVCNGDTNNLATLAVVAAVLKVPMPSLFEPLPETLMQEIEQEALVA